MEEPAAAPSPRIGTAEREAAQAALDQHLQAGRLEAEEYGERSAQVSVARTADDLLPLFADLPEPHPTSGPAGPTPSAAVAPRRGATLERIGPGVVAALPLIAVVLFFLVPIPNAWVFFLLVPLGGMIFAGARRRGGEDRD